MSRINLIKKLKKWKGQIILGIICVVLGVVVVRLYNKTVVLKDEREELINQQQQISTASIREELKEISKYSAYEFNYTAILCFSDKNKIVGVGIPFTGTKYIATIDGKMNVGIDGELVDFYERKGEDGRVEEVIITIPHSSILDNYTDSSTLQEYEYDKGIGNPINPTESNELRIKAEESEQKKVLESDILEKSDERIQYLLKSHFQAVYGEGVEIEIEYLE